MPICDDDCDFEEPHNIPIPSVQVDLLDGDGQCHRHDVYQRRWASIRSRICGRARTAFVSISRRSTSMASDHVGSVGGVIVTTNGVFGIFTGITLAPV